jgi:hypothetical protein
MWVTVYLSGAVVMSMGFADMTPAQCEDLRVVVEADIQAGVVEKDGKLWVEAENGDLLAWQEWEVVCEDEMLPIGTPQDE